MSVHSTLQRVVSAVASREDEIVENMIKRNVVEVPDLGLAREDPTVLEAYRASARANLRAGLAMLSDSTVLSGETALPAALPPEAVREARESARARVPLDALLRTYRVGHAVAWDVLIEEVERLVEDSSERQALLRMLNRHTFAYIDSVMPIVAGEYHAEGRRQARQLGQRRFEAVLALLDGSTTDTTNLNYDVRGWHLGLIAWGTNADTAVSAIAERLQRPALCVKLSEATAWGWVGGRSKVRPESWQRLDTSGLPDGASVAVGGDMHGLEGFRRTHLQAREAQRIGMALRNRVTRYADVAVEALALRDPDAARVFAEQILGPLKQARNADKLRQTLAAYLRCGLNASAAALSIGVNDRTVTYRLKVIEELTGQSLSTNRFEIEAAIRLERVIGQVVGFPNWPAAGGPPTTPPMSQWP